MLIVRFLFVFLALFWATVPFAQAEGRPEWFECTQDTDCVLVGTGCTIHAVTRSFSEEANKYYVDLDARKDCASPQDANSMKAVCRTQKTACIRKKFFGLVEEIDPASTCAIRVCAGVPEEQP